MINQSILISPNASILETLSLMDKIERKLLIVIEDGRFLGVISIGDIQRALLKKIPLTDKITTILRKDIIVANKGDSFTTIKAIMTQNRIECMPVIDESGNLIDTIEWENVFEETYRHPLAKPVSVVIMAGGKGTRLKPLTNIIPKPLIPISDKTIIEEIIERFTSIGCNNFFVTVNYMADEIEEFFSRHENVKYSVKFAREKNPQGTAGSLFLLRNELKEPFFVSNCDILADVDFSEMMEYHKKEKNTITTLSVLKSYNIPYGTLETKENGQLIGLKEKPNIVYQINSGIYIVEPSVFRYMKENEFIHITDLINRIMENGEKVGVFPISEGSWFDMGNWEEYLKIIRKSIPLKSDN